MAPGYRDGSWAADRDSAWDAFALRDGATAAPLTCPAPPNASLATGWKANGTYHEPCGPKSYCCLTNDYYGCDATWDLGDRDGWVDVLRQDTLMGLPFDATMARRDAHDRTAENYAILDELAQMRRLDTGRLELRLEWPNSGLQAMHWEQRMNPARFTARTKDRQYDEDLDYVAIETPYFEYNDWGGLEFDGEDALLDGSFDSGSWWYAVGSFQNTIPMTEGDDYVDDAWGTEAVLRARPDAFYFEPRCVRCEACYDADGRFLSNATVRTGWANATCKLGEPCSVNASTYETRTGCPDRCRGLGLRAFEAAAPHEVLVVAHRYESDANCTDGENATCGGYADRNAADVGFSPVYAPGVGRFEGFFVAPVAANYTFYATFDAGSSLELSVSESGDPRRRAVVLRGGAASEATSDSLTEFDGWHAHGGHWYKVFDDVTASHEDARALCGAEGAYLAELDGGAENDFVYGLLEAAGIQSGSTWIGGARTYLGMWTWDHSGEVYTVGRSYETRLDAAYSNWDAYEPNAVGWDDACCAFWGGNKWDDQSCSNNLRFVCESASANRAKSDTFELAKGEARYFELLHVHASNLDDFGTAGAALLGLDLDVAVGNSSFRTTASGGVGTVGLHYHFTLCELKRSNIRHQGEQGPLSSRELETRDELSCPTRYEWEVS